MLKKLQILYSLALVFLVLGLVSCLMAKHPKKVAYGGSPAGSEMKKRDLWVKENFQHVQKTCSLKPAGTAAAPAGLLVRANNDPVQKNFRDGQPLTIGETEYKRGLYCHAYSNILVRLPARGREFTALAGLDKRAGGGAVVFAVKVAETEVLNSGVFKKEMPALPVRVNLQDAKEFTLEIGDGGDGIGGDQVTWADAKVVLADGTELWLDELNFIEDVTAPQERAAAQPPFSFRYGDKSSDELLASWEFSETKNKIDDRRTRCIQTYTDPQTGLVVRCERIEYQDFPTVEWTLHFKNTGKEDTPILSEIRSIDTILQRKENREFLLHHFTGAPSGPVDYAPHELEMNPSSLKKISTSGGRPTNSNLPNFNIEWDGGGVIVVIGWPGQWDAFFVRDAENRLRISGGQEQTHFTLHPDEEVRTPLSVMQFYEGDWIRAQNIWRRWMFAHNLPQPGGKPLHPQMAACSSHQYGEMTNANEENQKMFIDGYLKRGLDLDYWWMDCGWFIHACTIAGTWEVDKIRFPNGLRAISDYAHQKGVGTILWFEPEHVWPGTWLYDNHQDWLLFPPDIPGIKNQANQGQPIGGRTVLDLGNPLARQWVTDHFVKLMDEEGIDVYRQDFNIEPLLFWQAKDTPDRRGITEIRYVEGYLKFWDDMLQRRPNMLIDTCASGGRRNDLETLRRAVPLLRSDYILEPVGQQNHTYGMAFWIPFFGSGINQFDSYGFRSCMFPHITACYDMRREDQDYTLAKIMYDQWRQIAPNYWGDFYPLTPYSPANNVWMAWQFDRPEVGKGMVQAFRRADNGEESQTYKLQGLNPGADYIVTDLDVNQPQKHTGRDLMGKGLVLTAKEKPAALVITYEMVK